MALGDAVEVVETLERLKADNRFQVKRLTPGNIKALALDWLNVELSTGAIRDTLAAGFLEIKVSPYGYEVSELLASLDPGGPLQDVLARAKEDPQWK